ncbi:Actin-like protein [Diplodia seriata]|uniref:Actin-like protein n=1 Tax=Diplodia seriata TaxID=420778 RepID=A0A1S8B5L7_9PEZI|nr:Actin-like protein [Diplodia seriata]
MGSRLLNAPIVLDNGSGTIRAGFAGQDLPKCYFPSYVGRPKHVRALAGALEGDVFIGRRAQELRGLLKINYPLEHGIVTDWDDMERIWQYVYAEELKTVSEDVSFQLCAASFELAGVPSDYGAERFRAPEILFNPELIGSEYQGVHQLVVNAINRTDLDLRKDLFGSIVLSGGSTLTKGFGDRLLHEVQRLAVKDMRIKIYAPPERKYTTWTGGSILAGLSTFKKVSRATTP